MVVLRGSVETSPRMDMREVVRTDYTLMHYRCIMAHAYQTHWSIAGLYHEGEYAPRPMNFWDADCPKCGLPGELVEYGMRGCALYDIVMPSYPVVIR